MTGTWAKKACDDAKKVGNVNVLFDGKADNYLNLPDPKSLKVTPGAAYLHLTSNETIGGVQWQDWPETGDVPLFCDMSSDFMSRRIPVEKFSLIYAGAQKNVGPAGAAVVIVREDLLERCPASIPAYLDYRLHVKENSLYNTPPVFVIWMIKLTMEWLKGQGGLPAAEKLAAERSGILYDAIERHAGFYNCPVPKAARSKMNVVFRLQERGARGEVPRGGQEAQAGRAEGPPLGGRLPRLDLQRHAGRGGEGAGAADGRVRDEERLIRRRRDGAAPGAIRAPLPFRGACRATGGPSPPRARRRARAPRSRRWCCCAAGSGRAAARRAAARASRTTSTARGGRRRAARSARSPASAGAPRAA